MMNKRFLYGIAALAAAACLLVAADLTPQQKYIDTYSGIAVSEMIRSGVPASITLAQGMLESGNGLSKLASEGNNHFGIKCHDWKGRTMKVDDDRKGECFRVYDSAAQSFSDHSDFLRFRSRYQSLFDLPVTDYKAWAYGLKKAGYATDPAYPEKLIRIIEEYGLARFDVMVVDTTSGAAMQGAAGTVVAVLPPSPRKLEEFTFSAWRKVYSLNGADFVYSEKGDSYASIAEEHELFENEVLRYNDLDGAPSELLPGTVVYISSKKSQAVEGMDKYIVEGGEDLWDICQRFAVKMRSVRLMNGFLEDHILHEGDTVLLRRPQKPKPEKTIVIRKPLGKRKADKNLNADAVEETPAEQ